MTLMTTNVHSIVVALEELDHHVYKLVVSVWRNHHFDNGVDHLVIHSKRLEVSEDTIPIENFLLVWNCPTTFDLVSYWQTSFVSVITPHVVFHEDYLIEFVHFDELYPLMYNE